MYMCVCVSVCEVSVSVIKYRGGCYLSRTLFSLRLNMLMMTVGDNSILGSWLHLFGARW